MSTPKVLFGAGYLFDHPSPSEPVVDLSQIQTVPTPKKEHDLSDPKWVLDQGLIGTCTCNAVATAYRYELKRRGMPDFMTSRLYLYYLARLGSSKSQDEDSFDTITFYRSLGDSPPSEDMQHDTGSNILEAVKALGSLGAISEDIWEYNYALVDGGMMITEGNIVQYGQEGHLFAVSTNGAYPPNDECFRKTIKHFDLRYSLIETKVESWKACINMGRPVIFGFNIYQSFNDFAAEVTEKMQDQNFIAPIPKILKEKNHGGHAVLAVGWDDRVLTKSGGTTGCFLMQNSWGSNWGDKGFCWIPFEWLTMEGLVVSSVAMIDPQTSGP